MTKQFSYPKNKIKVLLLENIHATASQMFSSDGFDVESRSEALSENELVELIKGVHILGIRSKTLVTEKVINNAEKLLAIGAFCIGTNQINITACNANGIAIFNAPYSNTRSVVELAIGEIIMLLRNIFPKSNAIQQGIWDKSSKNNFELRGKTIGIIGYGLIGTQLSILSESLGMKVLFYDIGDKMPLGNAECYKDLGEMLAKSDIVSLHIDGRTENENIINANLLSKMKKGSYFLNLSRGNLVDYKALKKMLESGHILGAGIDVYPYEPKSNEEKFTFELQGLPNVILTPHIGGSTEEAQLAIGSFVPDKILQYINTGTTAGCVNLPIVHLPTQNDNHRILHIHKNISGILARINNIIANNKVNITGQYLKTNTELGYVIIDIEGDYPDHFIEELTTLDNTIKSRILY